jgi:hypothetical protein
VAPPPPSELKRIAHSHRVCLCIQQGFLLFLMYREQVELALLLVLLMVVGFALWVIWLEICVFSEESSRRRLRNLGGCFFFFFLKLKKTQKKISR